MKLDIKYYGCSVLRQKSEEIREINDEVREFISSMIETLDSHGNGIGLAAPQVDKLWRIFIAYPIIQNENDEYEKHPLKVFINPKFTYLSKEVCEEEEGCLSLPGINAKIIRPTEVIIEYIDIEGKLHKEKVSGYYARELMHEMDHLDGILFIDHLSEQKRKELEDQLENIKML